MRVELVPTYDEFIKCERPDCVYDNAVAITGLHGMFGGGNGPYTVCANCGDLLSKSFDDEILYDSHAVEIKDVEDNQAARAVNEDGRPDDDKPA